MSSQLDIRVQPRAKKNAIEVIDENRARAWVTAPPEKDRANKALVDLLSKKLGVSKGSIAILRGAKSRNKLIAIDGLDIDQVLHRLALP